MNPKELHQFVNYLYMISVYHAKGNNLLENYTRTVKYLAKLQHILAEKLEELEEQHNL